MGEIYLPTGRNYWPKGTPVKICHEGKVTPGGLVEYDADKSLVGVKTADGKVQWAYQAFVTLDRSKLTSRK